MDQVNLPERVAPRPSGANQRQAADHNARLVLSSLHRHGPTPAAELARRTGLTAQAVSGIVRRLEDAGLVERGEPLRGQVGKPRVPVAVRGAGAWAIGVRVGRAGVEALAMDLAGRVHARREAAWEAPLPGPLDAFLRRAVPELQAEAERSGLEPGRLCGSGVAMPWQVWAWRDGRAAGAWPAGADPQALWAGYDLAARLRALAGAPAMLCNDATSAARAELAWGPPRPQRDWFHVHVGTFVGGGVVLDGRVRDGRQGNAGAFGSLSSGGGVLIDRASLFRLHADPARDAEDRWLDRAGPALAQAALDVCAVIDFEAVVIDGAFEPALRDRLVDRVRSEMPGLDARGLLRPVIEPGTLGAPARALGAATAALERAHLLVG
ncbi:ROK family protein [Jannaschia sp. W003]|uniref:ROK family protein n=1 Tax=Jannaschia sp. W003 TaxID=2867012 RepID=UPI0021A5E062|nr:ROK family protein [Jannaschia sp. W003]UWQ21515.1 ROK family protein [Jannaschia sp. W003]